MYNSLTGTVTYAEGQSLWLLINGIEYDLTVPTVLTSKIGTGVLLKVYTYLHHKEDSMRLFGFESVRQRDLFLQLLKVDGVGPKQAVSVLGAAPPAELAALIEKEDVGALSTIPGLGPKKAAKIILALRGRLTAETRSSAAAVLSPYADLVRALADMGFAAKQAETVVAEVAAALNPDADDFEQKLFREAIVRLSSF